MVELQRKAKAEWTFEGNQKWFFQSMCVGVGHSVIKSQHMLVCVKWTHRISVSSRVAPQDLHPVPAFIWGRIFYLSRKVKGDKPYVRKEHSLQDLLGRKRDA